MVNLYSSNSRMDCRGEVILDYLLSQREGNTLYFHIKTCPLNLLKEAILRGFQIHCLDNVKIYDGLVQSSQIENFGGYIHQFGNSHSSGVMCKYNHITGNLESTVFCGGEGYGNGFSHNFRDDRRKGGKGFACGYGQMAWDNPDPNIFGELGERDLTTKGMNNLRCKYQWEQSLTFSSEGQDFKPLFDEEYFLA